MKILMALCITGVLAKLPIESQTSASTRSFDLEHFDVTVTLSEKARQTLTDKKETIVVSAMFHGNPKKDSPGDYFEDHVPDNLGVRDIEIQPGAIATFSGLRMQQDSRNHLDGRDPDLLINVVSGRRSSKDNLLECDIYEGKLKAVSGKTIPISCKLIHE